MNYYNPDLLMHQLCEDCQRHSISADAKKQCKYLGDYIADENAWIVTFKDDNFDCKKFKKKVKQGRKGYGRKQKESLFD